MDITQTISIPRLVIAGTQSGVGKTTIVAGLLAAYRERGLAVQAFKVGPDYIDPGFHKLASGRDSYNLDTWLVGADRLVPFFTDVAADADLAIVEGVMGLYDGGRAGISSTADIAKRLQAPVVLVIDTRSMGESAAALALGFKQYDTEIDFRGVLLNRLGSKNHETMIRQAMERLHIPVLGCIHRDERLQSPERHLGLTPVTETDPTVAIKTICETVQRAVHLDDLLETAQTASPLTKIIPPSKTVEKRARIGVALDEAFSFYYPASLETLGQMGADIITFSPLTDRHIPEVDGLFFGGGFPEMFLGELEGNQSMCESIRKAADRGMPIYAECGGLMYLGESITDFDGNIHKTCGIIPTKTIMQPRLQRVGYVTATAERDSILTKKGDVLKGHEFHFSTMDTLVGEDSFSWAFSLEGGRVKQTYKGGYVSPGGNVVASYLHINFAGSTGAAERFIQSCADYGAKRICDGGCA